MLGIKRKDSCSRYRPDLVALKCKPVRRQQIHDVQWTSISKTRPFFVPVDPDNATTIHADVSVKGFINANHVSEYTNVILQCILCCDSMRRKLLTRKSSDAMRAVAQASLGTDVQILNSFAVRQLAGGTFVQEIPQGASEFFLHIINSYTDIRAIVKHELTHTIRCKCCHQTSVNTEDNIILTLPLSQVEGKRITFHDIINTYSEWNTVDDAVCTHCGQKGILSKSDITTAENVFIIQLPLFHNKNGKIVDIKRPNIAAAHTESIHVAQNTYRATSAVLYIDSNSKGKKHYTCYIKHSKKTFVYIDDDTIQYKKQWPRGAKDVYVMFFERSNVGNHPMATKIHDTQCTRD
ncbi:uncharacterized protein LOC123987994 [Osmia bicornis bicornis]|uniref:uncharacterized protein LOC123987994 n=1 Tax=Osmia bicornis bicornis TaxID=1437191 RepID=UPI001EAEFEC6|nr:uncharacterized protein LOC123987994 [Osmia bicornis bicornis]